MCKQMYSLQIGNSSNTKLSKYVFGYIFDVKALEILTKAIEKMNHPVPMAELLEVRAFIKESIGEIEVKREKKIY